MMKNDSFVYAWGLSFDGVLLRQFENFELLGTPLKEITVPADMAGTVRAEMEALHILGQDVRLPEELKRLRKKVADQPPVDWSTENEDPRPREVRL